MVGVVFNPNAGRGRAMKLRPELERRLQENFAGGWIICTTEMAGGGGVAVERLLQSGATRIVSAGGDGTLTECLEVLLPTDIPLGVIPVGTGNDFGRQIGVRTIEEAFQTLSAGHVASVDVGVANGKPFLDTLACGFDSAVGQRVNEGFKLLKGTLAYVGAISSTLWTYQPAAMEVDVDGLKWEGRAMLAAVCNCRSYGGGFQVAPQASIVDGLLDIVVVERMAKPRFLTQLPKVMKGRHLNLPEVHHWTGRRITLKADPPIRWMLDGELQDLTPIEVSIQAGARPMIVPSLNVAL